MKGIVLAGGTGSRLWPITRGIGKQLLPVYDKPLIYYPISTLMLAGIREIAIITTSFDQEIFIKLLGDGSQFGVKFTYFTQNEPKGIAQAFLICREFIYGEVSALILGDNIFHGYSLETQLANFSSITGAHIFATSVTDPTQYGVVETDKNNNIISIVEKPAEPKSNLAIPGLYFFDQNVSAIAERLTPSARGEIEITSIISEYLLRGHLKLSILPSGTTWLDTGTFNSLHDAGTYVRVIEERQGTKIACLEEIAFRNKWITAEDLASLAKAYNKGPYHDYLLRVESGV